MKSLLGHETWSLGLKLHNLSEYAGHQVGPNEAGNQNFSFLGLIVKDVGVAQISRSTATARVRRNFFFRSYHVF
jgi:hypothetical protein